MADAQISSQLVINAQYVKDQSFENPNAPDIFSAIAQGTPNLNISIDVTPKHLKDRTYEVVLTLRADARLEDTVAFLSEIDFAAVVTLGESLSEAQTEQMLMIHTPQYIFPFARAVMASATREGGFPPLVINPVDFGELYRTRQKKAEASAAEG